MSPFFRSLSRLLACWLLLTAAGCATLNVRNFDFRSRKATVRNPAIKVVCLWEPAEGRDPKGVPCQGFAGQILFLNSTSLPISVEGDIKIYLFDDHGTAAEQAKPLHEFNFDSEAWAQHYTYGTLGPAYNVFVPYMRRGVNDATCALRLRLTPATGPALFSEMTSIELLNFQNGRPGIKNPASDSRVEATIPDNLTSTNNRRRTTTIVLNGKNGAAEVVAESTGKKKVPTAISEADLDVKPLTNDDSRIAQLEQMVKELRALQGDQNSSKIVQAAASVTAPLPAPPRRLEETEGQGSRMRLQAVPVATPVRSKPQELLDDESTSDRSEVKREVRTVAQNSRHPLGNEASATVSRSGHPLDDSNGSTSPTIRTAVNGNRPVKRRHPLEDGDQPADTATRKSLPPKNSSQVEQDRNSSFDPFDPITTDAIETSAVQENRALRRQLRSAQ